MIRCAWCVSHIVQTLWVKLTLLSKSPHWPTGRGRLSVWMGSVMRHTASQMLGIWGQIFICFRPIKPMDPIRGSWWCAVNWRNCCPIRPIHSMAAAFIKNSRPQDPIMHRSRPVRGWWIILMRWPPIMVARIYPHPNAVPWSTPCFERPKLPAWNH